MAAILQPVEMHTIQAGEFGKLILRDSFPAPKCPDSLPDEPVYVSKHPGYGARLLGDTCLKAALPLLNVLEATTRMNNYGDTVGSPVRKG